MRRLLVAFAAILVVLVGSTVVGVALVAARQDGGYDDDDALGGPNNPMTVRAGAAFDVLGFSYAPGWDLVTSGSGSLGVRGLRVTNGRDRAVPLYVTIKVISGYEVLASARCYANDSVPIAVGGSVDVGCTSDDPLPQTWDRITVQDSF